MVEVLLKPKRDIAPVAEIMLKQCDESLTHRYAIKEFSAGPFFTYVYLHNQIVRFGLSGAQSAVTRLFMKRNKQSTCQEALTEAGKALLKRFKMPEIETDPDGFFDLDEVLAKKYVDYFRHLIRRAWNNRDTLTTKCTPRLKCFPESGIKLGKDGCFSWDVQGCKTKVSCDVAVLLRRDVPMCKALKSANDAQPKKSETQRRGLALKALARSNRSFQDNECRSLGDAAIVFLCPIDYSILTTNSTDHSPLAAVMGKSVVTPSLPKRKDV